MVKNSWLESSAGRAVCTGIEEVMGLNPVQAEFFSEFNFNCLSCAHNSDDQSCLQN